jgi:hypothetical protein
MCFDATHNNKRCEKWWYHNPTLRVGLSASVSFILQEKGATYAEQGIFSLASWPFSLKILWAPIVDSLYLKPIGRVRTFQGWALSGFSLHVALFCSRQNTIQSMTAGVVRSDYVM